MFKNQLYSQDFEKKQGFRAFFFLQCIINLYFRNSLIIGGYQEQIPNKCIALKYCHQSHEILRKLRNSPRKSSFKIPLYFTHQLRMPVKVPLDKWYTNAEKRFMLIFRQYHSNQPSLIKCPRKVCETLKSNFQRFIFNTLIQLIGLNSVEFLSL